MPKRRKRGTSRPAPKCRGAKACVHYHAKQKPGIKLCKLPQNQRCVHFHPGSGKKKSRRRRRRR